MTEAVLSTYLENQIINHTLRNVEYTSPGSSIYLALFSDATAQDDDNSGTELTSGSGYARVNVTAWDAPTSGSLTNTSEITFETATGNWETIRYVGLMDAETSGSLLCWGQLSADKTVTEGDIFYISAGDFDLYLSGAYSDYLRDELLNHVFRNTAYSTPGSAIYLALYIDNPTVDDTGTEVSAGVGYSRLNVTDWAEPTSGSTSNAAVEAFDSATSAWGTITHLGIRDDETSGSLLYFGALSGSKVVAEGDTFQFSASALTLTVN